MKIKKLEEICHKIMEKNPEVEVQILVSQENLERILKALDQSGGIPTLFEPKINEEEEENFIESGLMPIFLGDITSDLSDISERTEKPSRIEIVLGHSRVEGVHPSWKRMHVIPLSNKTRSFFPGFKEPFIIYSDVGKFRTYVVSTGPGESSGRYISKGLSKWYKEHQELKPGDIIVFDVIEPGKIYKMSIKYEEKIDEKIIYIINEYIEATMNMITYNKIGDQFNCRIPLFSDITTSGKSFEECKDKLESLLYNYVISKMRQKTHLPIVDGLDLNELI